MKSREWIVGHSEYGQAENGDNPAVSPRSIPNRARLQIPNLFDSAPPPVIHHLGAITGRHV